MNWLKWLWNVATRVVLPLVTAVQRVAQQREAASKQKPETKAVTPADGVSKPKPAAPSLQPPQIPQRRTAPPERDIGPRIDPTPAPVITPGERRALQDLLDKPTKKGLHLLVEPDAEIVLKVAHRIPGILETAIQNCGSFKGAFDYLLADGVRLAEEEIAALLEQVGFTYEGQVDPCSPYPGWYLREDGMCIFLGEQTRTPSQDEIPAGGDTAGDKYDAVLTPEQLDRYMRWVTLSGAGDHMRQLFLAPAQLLNDPAITNMSANALAMLTASQTIVEEKWHKGLMSIHPFYNRGDDPWPALASFGPLREERFGPLTRSFTENDKRRIPGEIAWYAARLDDLSISPLHIIAYVLNRNDFFMWRENEKPLLLQGVGYGLGNQTFPMAWAAALWYENYAAHNIGAPRPDELPSEVFAWLGNEDLAQIHLIAELGDYGATPLDEIPDPTLGQKSGLWNTIRFLFAAAAQREGTSEPSGNFNYITLENLSEANLEGLPGRPIHDVSAFSLLTTVYSGSVTVPEFALFSMGGDRSGDDALGAAIAERNKAIEVVERMMNEEGQYRIGQPMGIAPLTTKYGDPINGDFLPYSREEAELLVRALVQETPNPDPNSLLCRATLLRRAYEFYFSATAWNDLVGVGCGG